MQTSAKVRCSRVAWKEREGYAIENDRVRLVTLAGGGHIAEFRFREGLDVSTLNPLWEPPWKAIEPYQYKEAIHGKKYGELTTGKLLSGVAGHSLCLDYFGAPSPEESRQGLSIHGEAPSSRWRATRIRTSPRQAQLEMAVRLPAAGLRFARQISIRQGESVAYFRETVFNERKADHFFHWTQHVTLGPPFLHPKHSRTFIPGDKGRTFPHGYEGKELLQSSRDFRWPLAPGVSGEKINLSQPFIKSGRGFVATVLLKPDREVQSIAALNTRENLIMGYCFRRADFPWVAVWEENCARPDPPWNGKCQSRGLEFGSTPFPVGRREAFANGPLFGAPHFSVVPAKGRVTAHYVSFLAAVPKGFVDVRRINVEDRKIVVEGRTRGGKAALLEIPAAGLRKGSMG